MTLSFNEFKHRSNKINIARCILMSELYIFVHDKYEIIISRYCCDLMKLAKYYTSMIVPKLCHT